MANTKLDIDGIKDAMVTLFSSNNNVSGSPVDLSADLSRRVVGIYKINPERLGVQLSQLPAVTVWTDGKEEFQQNMGVSQINARRHSHLMLNIAGILWNDDYDYNEDTAETDIIALMENVESILRGDPTLGGTVLTSMIERVSYFTIANDRTEQANYRVGLMRYRCRVEY